MYDASVGVFVPYLPNLSALLDKGVAHAKATGVSETQMLDWRLIGDMAPLSFQLMVVINFNMDLGDAWEHADVPEYALQYTTRAYKYAINYILYAMTH